MDSQLLVISGGQAMRRKLFVLVSSVLAVIVAAPTLASGTPSDLSLRDTVAEQLGPLQAILRTDYPDSFGGLWVTQTGTPVIADVGAPAALADAVGSYELAATPEIREVTYSERYLEALHAAILEAAGDSFSIDGIQLAAIETDIVRNRVNVYAVNSTVAELSGLESRLGPGVFATSTTDLAVGNACMKSNCPNPLKGALWLYQASNFWCMSGFIFRYPPNSTYYLATAGHCSSIGDTYQHPSGTSIGHVTHQGWASNSAADVSLIAITAANKSNLIMASNSTTRAMTSRENPSNNEEVIGEGACASKKSATNCGSLISNNNTVAICEGGTCKTIVFLRRASVSSSPGDSGSPFYYGNKAMGILSASFPGAPGDSLYSHVRLVETKWGMVTQLSP